MTVFSSSVIVFAVVNPRSKLVFEPVKNVLPVSVMLISVFETVSTVWMVALVDKSVSVSPTVKVPFASDVSINKVVVLEATFTVAVFPSKSVIV